MTGSRGGKELLPVLLDGCNIWEEEKRYYYNKKRLFVICSIREEEEGRALSSVLSC